MDPAKTSRPGTSQSAVGMDPEQVARLQKLKLWKKLKAGELHLVTRENVTELFKVLDTDDTGDLRKDDLLMLRQVPGVTLTENDLRAIADDCDRDNSGRVTEEELYKAITEGELAFSFLKEALGKNAKNPDEKSLELTKVIECLQDEYETSSALWSLPQTLLLFSMFLVLMSTHLDLTKAYDMQLGLQNEIDGEGYNFLRNHPIAIVHDVPTMWQWMDTSFVNLHFKNAEGDLTNFFPYTGRVASYNQIIGGIRLTKTQVRSPELCPQSDILRAAYDAVNGGLCHRSDDSANIEQVSEYLFYHERLETIREHLSNLSSSLWINQNVSKLDVNTLFYNAHLQAFTDCHLTFLFQESGFVKILLTMETWHSDPYYDKAWVLPDLVYALILLRMLWNEAQEILPAARAGLDGIINYMEFWNIVDWCSIFVGGVVMCVWGLICYQVSGEMQTLMAMFPKAELDTMVMSNHSYLPPETFVGVHDKAVLESNLEDLLQVSNSVGDTHELLRNLVFWYNFVLMMKFFKAFQANPRLDIVIRTLTKSAVEIIHFLIVFMVIFLVFSSAGYVVFGKSIKGFRDQYQAMAMCWQILMGDFDVPSMEIVNYYYAHVWIFSFQFMVLLILLNMLLAIIMDTYVAAKQEAGDPKEQVTIWTQIKDACYTIKETRGHIKLYDLLLELQDEDYPAHPNPVVTSKSLRRAFAKMTKHQADYIMRLTVDSIKRKAGEIDIGLSDTVRVLSLLKVNVLRTASTAQEIYEMLKAQTRLQQSSTFDAIFSGEEQRKADKGLGPPAPKSALLSQSAPPALPGMVPLSTAGSLSPPMRSISMQQMPPTASSNTAASLAGGGGGGGELPPGTHDILAMLAEIRESQQEMAEDQRRLSAHVAQQLAENRQYIEERDSWFETRMAALDRRCEKMFLASEKTLNCLDGVDFTELMEVPKQIEQLLPRRGPRGEQVIPSRAAPAPRSRASSEEDAEADEDRDEVPSGQSSAASRRPAPAAASAGSSKRLEKQLESISRQLEELLSHANEATEQRRLLWKIDLGIRQFRQETKDLPQAVFDMLPKEEFAATRGARRMAAKRGMTGTLRGTAAEGDASASPSAGPSLAPSRVGSKMAMQPQQTMSPAGAGVELEAALRSEAVSAQPSTATAGAQRASAGRLVIK